MKSCVRAWPVGTVTVLLAAIAAAVWMALAAWSVGERDALQHGEVWRAWTAHAVHFSTSHLLWSGLVWLVAGGLMERENRRAWLANVMVAAPLVTVAALALDADLARYGGLSGLATVGVVWLGVGWAWERDSGRRWMGVVMLAAVAAKIAWELSVGSRTPMLADFDRTLGDVRVAAGAHVAGAACGVLLRLGTLRRSR